MAKNDPNTPGLTLQSAQQELSARIDDAVQYSIEYLEPEWDLAERYYNGECDLEDFPGRSAVVKTEVRDAIRNSMPSIMRTLLHSRKPVVYQATSPMHGSWVEQQSDYVTSLFYKNNGYMVLYNTIMEALKLKRGIVKAFWEEDPLPTFFEYSAVPYTTLEELIQDPYTEVEDYEESDTQLGDVPLYRVTGYKLAENGNIVMEAIPNYEFFMTKNCSTIEEAIRRGVHGQKSIMTVAEAMDMGLKHDDWSSLSSEDPETTGHTGSSTERRKATKDVANKISSDDLLKYEFLYTEAYCMWDLEGTGRPQLYRFCLGGSSYEILHHNKVEDSPYSIIQPMPVPHSSAGHSMVDLTVNEQDSSTSMLRATVDNAHLANDFKLLADPKLTNFDDLMSKAIGIPVRSKNGANVQVLQVPSAAQGNLGLLQYLDLDVQNKIGMTKASQGLDPNALQSTDKDAVLNTIMSGQGQTELLVRNIVETGLIRLFGSLLRLSIRHMAPMQIMMTKGKVIPVDTRMFDPSAVAVPNVGLGTGSPEQRQAALNMILQRQEMYMEKFGPNNPFTSFVQIYNTLEDILETAGMHNTERYFNVVTPNVEKAWAESQEKRMAEQAKMAAENAPMDPSKAYMQIEAQKREIEKLKLVVDQSTKAEDRALVALTKAEELDIKRDEMAQNRVISLVEIGQEAESEKIKQEQQNNERISPKRTSSGEKST